MDKFIKIAGIIFILACMLLICACSKNAALDKEKRKNIFIIMKAGYGNHLDTIRMGAEAAAKEFSVNVEFKTLNRGEEQREHKKLVDTALKYGMDALVLAVDDLDFIEEVVDKLYDLKIPVIVINSEISTKGVSSVISTDNFNAGEKAGDKLAKITGECCKVLVMGGIKEDRNIELREQGLFSVIRKYPKIEVVAREYCFCNVRLAAKLTKKVFSENEGVDAIVALDAASSMGAGDAVKEMNLSGRVKIIAFDSTQEIIEHMEEGIIQAVVIQNPFGMGYMGVNFASKAIDGRKVPRRVDTGSKVIDRDGIYLTENQKLLFPFVK